MKTGAGTQIKGGNNSYSGTTTVSAGTLVVNGEHTGGDYFVNGGVLGGTGTINATVNVTTGTLAAGNSIGTLNINSSLNIGGTFEWEFDSASNAADIVNVLGNVDLTGSMLNIQQLGTFEIGKTFTVLSYSGSLTGQFNGIDTSMWTINYASAVGGLNTGGSHANFVTLTAVPEPSALLLVGSVLGAGFLRRRR